MESAGTAVSFANISIVHYHLAGRNVSTIKTSGGLLRERVYRLGLRILLLSDAYAHDRNVGAHSYNALQLGSAWVSVLPVAMTIQSIFIPMSAA